jgi:hypothetical protein
MISLVGPRAAATAASKPSKCKTVVNVTDSEPESTVTGFARDSKGNAVLPLHCTSCNSDPKLEQDDSKQITLGLELILFQLGKLSNSDLEFVIRKISTRLLLKDGPTVTVSAARDSESFRVCQDYFAHPVAPTLSFWFLFGSGSCLRVAGTCLSGQGAHVPPATIRLDRCRRPGWDGSGKVT